MSDAHFKHCSICKKPIAFEAEYVLCSVSTCNRKRLEMFFCSVPCWDAHVPEARHRDAWAEPARAPSQSEWNREQAREATPARAEASGPVAEAARKRRVVGEQDEAALPRDVLIVISKLKKYIRERSGMNTSDNVTEVLSDHLRTLCVGAIRHAAENERKTVMDRDFTAVLQKQR
jgi:histone H3/H4